MIAEGGFALPGTLKFIIPPKSHPKLSIDDEDVADDVVKINNISHTYKYNEVEFSQSDFATYLKAYMKKLKKSMKKLEGGKERVKEFKT